MTPDHLTILIIGLSCAALILARALSLPPAPAPPAPIIVMRLVTAPGQSLADLAWLRRVRAAQILVGVGYIGMTDLREVSAWESPMGTWNGRN